MRGEIGSCAQAGTGFAAVLQVALPGLAMIRFVGLNDTGLGPCSEGPRRPDFNCRDVGRVSAHDQFKASAALLPMPPPPWNGPPHACRAAGFLLPRCRLTGSDAQSVAPWLRLEAIAQELGQQGAAARRLDPEGLSLIHI
mgnify:FL=1